MDWESEFKSVTLSLSQYNVIQTLFGGNSVFYTGAAGTGKSFILRILQETFSRLESSDCIAFTAPTGVAACNIGGLTVHSWAGIGLGTDPLDVLCAKISRNKPASSRWRLTKILVIDEVSMLSGELFDKLNIIGQRIRDNPDALFGGLQVVLCGDFFQLPPVGLGKTCHFCFESDTWKKLFGTGSEPTANKMIVLDKIFRQKDSTFINILNELRCGKVSQKTNRFLTNKCQEDVTRELRVEVSAEPAVPVEPDKKIKVDGDDVKVENAENAMTTAVSSDSCSGGGTTSKPITATRLFSVNRDVEYVNQKQLDALGLDGQVTYQCIDNGEEPYLTQLRAGLKVAETLKLCIGAQVMLLKNLNTANGLVNGTRGKVVQFTSDMSSAFDKIPVVEFYCTVGDRSFSDIVPIREEEWDIKQGEIVKASRRQIPLMHAWAISIHKAQGMTIPFLEVSFSNIFEYGQAYVSLSRATDLEGLILRNFDVSRVKSHGNVVLFYESMGYNYQKDTGELEDQHYDTKAVEMTEIVAMCKELLQIPAVTAKLLARKYEPSKLGSAKSNDNWIDANAPNSNIPPWIKEEEKQKRLKQSLGGSNKFFLPASRLNKTPIKDEKSAVSTVAIATVAPVVRAVMVPPTVTSTIVEVSGTGSRMANIIKQASKFDAYKCPADVPFGASASQSSLGKSSNQQANIIIEIVEDAVPKSSPAMRYNPSNVQSNGTIPRAPMSSNSSPSLLNTSVHSSAGKSMQEPVIVIEDDDSKPSDIIQHHMPAASNGNMLVVTPEDKSQKPVSSSGNISNSSTVSSYFPIRVPTSMPNAYAPPMPISSFVPPAIPPAAAPVVNCALDLAGRIEANRLAALKRLQENRKKAMEDVENVYQAL